jgi:two-component system, NarL family, response regulator LiaR
MKFLIVDDHLCVRALIRHLVTTPADEVRECTSGEEAVRVAREFMPDLVTMDIRLGKLNGIAATRALRDACPSAQIVVVTSYNQPELRQAAAAAGAVHFVVKDNLLELQQVIPQLAAAVTVVVARKQNAEK